ncbi:hypothetical protein V6N13_056156 [Hibiscus sabdariffa]
MGLRVVWNDVRNNIVWSIGSGTEIDFWWDTWIEDVGPLLSYVDPRLVSQLVRGPRPVLGVDMVGWRGSKELWFSIKSTYQLRSGMVDAPTHRVWNDIRQFKMCTAFQNKRLLGRLCLELSCGIFGWLGIPWLLTRHSRIAVGSLRIAGDSHSLHRRMSFLGRVLDEFVVVGVGGIRDMMVRVLVEWRFVDGVRVVAV